MCMELHRGIRQHTFRGNNCCRKKEMHFAKFISFFFRPQFFPSDSQQIKIQQSPQKCWGEICKQFGNYYVQIKLVNSSVKEFSITHQKLNNMIAMRNVRIRVIYDLTQYINHRKFHALFSSNIHQMNSYGFRFSPQLVSQCFFFSNWLSCQRKRQFEIFYLITKMNP